MTAAYPGANHCVLCMLDGVLTPAMEEWPGAPICREHVSQCIEANEPKVIYPPSGFVAAPTTLQ